MAPFWVNEHPFATYLDVHEGYRVLSHSPVSTYIYIYIYIYIYTLRPGVRTMVSSQSHTVVFTGTPRPILEGGSPASTEVPKHPPPPSPFGPTGCANCFRGPLKYTGLPFDILFKTCFLVRAPPNILVFRCIYFLTPARSGLNRCSRTLGCLHGFEDCKARFDHSPAPTISEFQSLGKTERTDLGI